MSATPILSRSVVPPPHAWHLHGAVPSLFGTSVEVLVYLCIAGGAREGGATRQVHPAAWAAKRRGVYFDIGHGHGSFNWCVARPPRPGHAADPAVIRGGVKSMRRTVHEGQRVALRTSERPCWAVTGSAELRVRACAGSSSQLSGGRRGGRTVAERCAAEGFFADCISTDIWPAWPRAVQSVSHNPVCSVG